jgi:phosphoglucosamine mutase
LADGLPTADGLLAGLRVLAALGGTLAGADAALARLCKASQAHAVIRRAVDLSPAGIVAREVRATEALGARVVVRESGTEPLVRVMVEHEDPGVAKAGADRLVAIAERG